MVSRVVCAATPFANKSLAGFTKRLLAKAHDSNKTAAYLEGPYGGFVDLRHNDSVVVVVGGSGVTYGLACLYSALDAAKVNKSAVRKFNFIWMLRSRGKCL